ncbi:MAG: hypothetical protein ACE144_16785 [Thermodesulfobacteriota bacterium]
MNWAHVHIALNHVPVMGVIFGFLLLAYAMLKKSMELVKVSFAVFVIVTVMTIPVFLTGHGAEEIVENLPGVTESIIEPHEEAGLLSLVGVAVLGVIGLGGLSMFRGSKTIPMWLVTISLIFSLAVGGWVARTANLGGQIRHTEIRSESTVSMTMEDQREHKEADTEPKRERRAN